MNYTSPYNPNYAASAAAYPQGFDPAALDAYNQAQQHAAALEQLQQMYGYSGASQYAAPQQYAMTYTGQTSDPMAPAAPGVPMGAAPANLTPLQGAWWQQNTYGVPRWGLAAGALALTGIGLAWQAGMFGGKSSGSRSTTRRTSRDANGRGRSTSISRSSGGNGGSRMAARTTRMDSDSARDANGRSGGPRRTTKRRSSSSRSRRRR